MSNHFEKKNIMKTTHFLQTSKGLLVTALLLLSSTLIKAKEYTDVQIWTGTSIATSINFTGTVNVGNNSISTPFNFTHVKSWVEVRLRYKDENRSIDTDEDFDVTYDVKLYEHNGTSTHLITDTVRTNYRVSNGYDEQDINVYIIDNVTIVGAELDVKAVNYTSGSIPSNLELTIEYKSIRYYDLSASGSTLSPNEASTLNTENQLRIYWSKYNFATGYDLEWVFVDVPYDKDDQSPYDNVATTLSGMTEKPGWDFKNATRVFIEPDMSLSTIEYYIQMAYSRGVLLYRVRPVGEKEGSDKYTVLRDEGSWVGTASSGTLGGSLTYGFIQETGVEEDHNWTYSANYAEQGKRQEQFQFFDGTARSRQEVTLGQTDETAIVGETVYDHSGRPAVKIMPVPVPSKGADFYTNTTTANAPFNNGYDASDFDVDRFLDSDAPVTSNDLSSTSDASKYYSSSNALSSDFVDYLPDAEDRPFTHVRYKNDGTDRVVSEAGPGEMHEMWDQNTEYYYARPFQRDIDKLFGNEGGYNKFYTKKYTKDPNDQLQLEYHDEQGRLIAHCLTGSRPNNLVAVDGQTAADITEDVLHNNNELIGDEWVSSFTFTSGVIPNLTYTFEYDLNADDFTLPCWGGSKDCKYEVELRIVDEEGDLIPITCASSSTGCTQINPHESPHFAEFPPTHPITSSYGQVVLSLDEATDPVKWTAVLEPGTYTMTKRIRVYEPEISTQAAALKSYLVANPETQTCLNYDEQTEEYCDNSCDGDYGICRRTYLEFDNSGNILHCWDDDGDKVDLVQPSGTIPTSIQDLIDDCKDACSDEEEQAGTNYCESRLGMMEDHMSPGGQYFDNTVDIWERDSQDPRQFALNSSGNKIANPIGTGAGQYNINEWISAKTIPTALATKANAACGCTADWDDVRTYWEDSWVDDIVDLHPEYEVYEYYCLDNFKVEDPVNGGSMNVTAAEIRDFHERMMASDDGNTDDNGTTKKLWNPTNMTTSTTIGASDPYMNISGTFYYDPLFSEARYSPDPDWKSRLEDSVGATIKNVRYQSYDGSIWYVIDDPENFSGANGGSTPPSNFGYSNSSHGPDANDLVDYLEALHGVTSNDGYFYDMTGVVTDPEWFFFRSYYLFMREFILYDELTNIKTTYTYWDDDTDYDGERNTDYFRLIWPPNQVYDHMASGNSNSTLLNTVANSKCTTNCVANAASYIAYLQSKNQFGNLTPTEWGDLQDDLEAFCLAGCDPTNNYQGTNTLPTPHPGTQGVNHIVTTNSTSVSTMDDLLDDYEDVNYPLMVSLPPPGPFSQRTCNYENLVEVADLAGATDPEYPTTAELTTIANYINNTLSASPTVTTAQVEDWYLYARDMDNTEDMLDFPLEMECARCKCDNYLRTAVDNGHVEDGSQVAVAYGTDIDLIDWSTHTINHDGMGTMVLGTRPTTSPGDTDWDDDVQQYFTDPGNKCKDRDYVPSFDQTYLADVHDLHDEYRCTGNLSVPVSPPCTTATNNLAQQNTLAQYLVAVESFVNDYKRDFYADCLDDLDERETWNLTYRDDEFMFTLYYYDQAGNLVKTVPPEGTRGETFTANADITDVRDYRDDPTTNTFTVPAYDMVTKYVYNTRDQVIKQSTPDAGITEFYYDLEGKLILSQNALQVANSAVDAHYYSYTLYDDLNRVIETGQVKFDDDQDDLITRFYRPPYADFEDLINGTSIPSTDKTEVIKTKYDEVYDLAVEKFFLPLEATNLRGRVATVSFWDDLSQARYNNALHYSYDIHGNVKMFLQENQDVRLNQIMKLKSTMYEYDLISGNVKKVYYQRNYPDQMIHRYSYDEDNRLVTVETSRDDISWDIDAQYEYYPHGPLARVEIGEKDVQGLDYAYTLQGWLKVMNANTLDSQRDIGDDGYDNVGNDHKDVGVDALGFSLGYYDWTDGTNHIPDYMPADNAIIDGSDNFLADLYDRTAGSLDFAHTSELKNASKDYNMYNGNISRMTVALTDESENEKIVFGNFYTHDQANRLKTSSNYTDYDHGSSTDLVDQDNSFYGCGSNDGHNSSFTYDQNGNILTIERFGEYNYGSSSVTKIDDMSYSYTTGTNKLKHITETGTSGSADFAVNSGAVGDYYSYDEIGQLTKDQHADIDEITWTLQGKVKKITFEDNAELEFKYDPLGNRLMKIYRPSTSNVLDNEITWVYTYYERDAQGQVMGIYEQTFSNTTGDEYSSDIKLNDLVIYGSDRLGTEQTEFHDQYLFCSNSYTNKLFDVDGTCNLTSYPLGGTTGSLDPGYAVCLPCTTEYKRGTGGNDGKLMMYSEHPVTIENMDYPGGEWPTNITGSNSGSGATKTFDANQYIEIEFDDASQMVKFNISGDNGIVWVSQTFGTPLTFDNSGSVISDGPGGGPVDPRYESKKIDYTRTLDNKKYELKNHLGNVLSVVSDRKLGVDPDTDNDFDYYTADIKSYSDYYPFGSVMPGRNSNSTDYRFGFNGMEEDNEVKGDNNSLDFGARIYDPRVGRWMSRDPLSIKQPGWSTYKAFLDNPVLFIDPDGKTEFYNKKGKHIGSDGESNNLIAIVNQKSLSKTIKASKRNGDLFEALGSINNGSTFDGGFALDKDILSSASSLLTAALNEGTNRELGQVMKPKLDGNGGFIPSLVVKGMEVSSGRNATVNLPSMDGKETISLHSHPTGRFGDKVYPSEASSIQATDGGPSDEELFPNFEMNITVGRRGISSDGLSIDKTPNINVYGSRIDNRIGGVSQKAAKRILKNENK